MFGVACQVQRIAEQLLQAVHVAQSVSTIGMRCITGLAAACQHLPCLAGQQRVIQSLSSTQQNVWCCAGKRRQSVAAYISLLAIAIATVTAYHCETLLVVTCTVAAEV